MTDQEILDKLVVGNYIKFSGTLYCEDSVGNGFLIPNKKFFRIEDQQSRVTDGKLEIQIKLFIGKTLLAPIFFSRLVDSIVNDVSLYRIPFGYKEKLLEILT